MCGNGAAALTDEMNEFEIKWENKARNYDKF
jgi:hypothetical protein